MPQWSCRLWFHYPAEGWGEHKCRLSLFQGISYLLFLQGFLPCMSGSAACQGLGEVCGLDFLGCTECWPCISGARCLKGGLNIYSLAGREGMQISLCSLRSPPAVIIAAQVFILWICSNLEWENVQDNLTHVQLCIFVPLCWYTDKITPQNQKVLKPLD